MEFVLILPGQFMMGTSTAQLDALAVVEEESYQDWIERETPQHHVVIHRPFYLGKYPVTQAQWQAVMGANPSAFEGENRPIESISWTDTQIFLSKLNKREGIYSYRLPAEAEWEYACRAGSRTLYHFGDDESKLSSSRNPPQRIR